VVNSESSVLNESLTDAELLSILISTGTKGKPAEKVAQEILDRFGSFKGMANQPLEKFLEIKGLGDVHPVRKIEQDFQSVKSLNVSY